MKNYPRRLYFFVAYLRLLLPALLQSRSPLLDWCRHRGNELVVRIVVRIAAERRLFAPCLNCRRRGRAAQALETARAAAKPG